MSAAMHSVSTAVLLPLAALVAACAVTVYRRAQKYPDLGVVVAAINTALYPLRWLRVFPFRDGNVVKIQTLMKEAMAVRDRSLSADCP